MESGTLASVDACASSGSQPTSVVARCAMSTSGSVAGMSPAGRDPIRAGNSVTYEVRVTNNAETSDRDIRVTITLPPQLTALREGITSPLKQPPRIENNLLLFDPVTEVRPGETLPYRFNARAVSPGNAGLPVSISYSTAPSEKMSER